jgi:hypothetical protein
MLLTDERLLGGQRLNKSSPHLKNPNKIKFQKFWKFQQKFLFRPE